MSYISKRQWELFQEILKKPIPEELKKMQEKAYEEMLSDPEKSFTISFIECNDKEKAAQEIIDSLRKLLAEQKCKEAANCGDN